VLQFLGYERGSKAYRLYNPASSKVVVSRDVVFDEAACWGWESDDGEATPGGLSSSFTIKYMAYSGAGELAHGEAEGTPSSEAEGTPSSEAEGTPSSKAPGHPRARGRGLRSPPQRVLFHRFASSRLHRAPPRTSTPIIPASHSNSVWWMTSLA